MALVAVAAVALVAACGQPGEAPAGNAAAAQPTPNPLLGPPNPAQGSTVRIGLFNAEGSELVDQPAVGDAAEAAVAYANDYLGGLGGHKIEVARCADLYSVDSSRACADRFVREGVAAVVVGQPTNADAIVPTILDAGIPWVGSTPISASETGSPDTFFLGAGFVGTLAGWAQYAKDVGYTSVTMYGIDSPTFTAAIDALGRPLFDKVGVSLKLVLLPVGGGGDTASLVEDSLSDNPDAVAVLTDTGSCSSVLTALHASQASQPRLITSACVEQDAIDAVGAEVIDNAVVFNVGNPSGTNPESQLYRYIMDQYAADVDQSGITLTGYLAMLGFIRAVNAGGLPADGEVTPQNVTDALRGARDVPRPVGDSGTFSCDRSALSTPALKSTICTSELLYTTYTGGAPGRYGKIDVAALVNS
jgi:branched-chain amino acid transport system substrate-binding protein